MSCFCGPAFGKTKPLDPISSITQSGPNKTRWVWPKDSYQRQKESQSKKTSPWSRALSATVPKTSTRQKVRPPTPFLVALPLEIRRMIYEYVLTSSVDVHLLLSYPKLIGADCPTGKCSCTWDPRSPDAELYLSINRGLLRTCRQM